MTNIPTWLDDGAGTATCALLAAGTGAAAAFAATSARSLLLWPALGGAAATAAFAAVGHAIGCAANPGNPTWTNPNQVVGTWCSDGTTGTKVERIRVSTGGTINQTGYWIEGDVDFVEDPVRPGRWEAFAMARNMAAGWGDKSYILLKSWNVNEDEGARFTPDPGCGQEGSQPIPLEAYTFNYTDASTTCNYTYVLQDTWIDGDGFPRLAWSVEGAAGNLRNNCQGGRIAGYVWAPTEGDRYTYNFDFDGPGNGPPGGPAWQFQPDWGAIGGLLLRLMEYNDPGDLYRLVSVCETDAQGEPVSQAVEVDVPAGFRNFGASARIRFNAMNELMQGLKDFRQPICRAQPTGGDLVTVHFQSDAASPNGEKRLRKLFRYRDQMATDLAGHAAHWENFTWNAGPVIVKHVGAAWGELQVWAEDADEGKRVIRHAGTIAGLNPDTEGEWVITDSADPRYGQPGTMRLARRQSAEGEFLRISKRPGPNGLPTVPFDS